MRVKIKVVFSFQVSDDQRERLAMSVERLCLEIELESRKTMMETEDLGVSVLQDLSQHSHSKVWYQTLLMLGDFKAPNQML